MGGYLQDLTRKGTWLWARCVCGGQCVWCGVACVVGVAKGSVWCGQNWACGAPKCEGAKCNGVRKGARVKCACKATHSYV